MNISSFRDVHIPAIPHNPIKCDCPEAHKDLYTGRKCIRTFLHIDFTKIASNVHFGYQTLTVLQIW